MKCRNCGKELNDQAKFCPKCGAKQVEATRDIPTVSLWEDRKKAPAVSPIVPQPVSTAIQKKEPMSKKKKILLILLAIFIVLSIAAVVIGVMWWKSPAQQIVRDLDDADYVGAMATYKLNYAADDDRSSLIRALESRLQTLQEDFQNEKIEYAVAQMELSTISEMSIEEISAALEDAAKQIDILNTSRTAYQTGIRMFNEKDYPGAIVQLSKVAEQDKNYEDAKDKLSQAIEKYRPTILNAAKKYADQKDLKAAISQIKTGLETIPKDSVLTEQLNVYTKAYADSVRDDAIAQADALMANNDIESAITLMANALEDVGEDSAMQAKYDGYVETYVTSVLKNAEQFLKERKFAEALSQVNAALNILPENKQLLAKQKEIQEENSKIKYLGSDILKYNSEGSFNEYDRTESGGFKMGGTNYASGMTFRPYYDNSVYSLYNLGGQYTTLEFYLGHLDNTEMKPVAVEIYLDDVLSKTITVDPGKLPQKYTISVKNAKQLKLLVKTTDGGYPTVGFGDTIVF